MMMAEESTSWPGVTKPTYVGGLGFHLKWNMGWMHDTLEYLSRDPIHRSWHHDDMTFSMVYAYSEQFVLPISHDEVVHGKGSMWGKVAGDSWRKAATLRSYYTHQWGHPGKQLLFMGSEIGAFDEWRESQSLPWWLLEHKLHAGLRHYVGDLNRFYREHPAMWSRDHEPAGFQWLDGGDRQRQRLHLPALGSRGGSGRRGAAELLRAAAQLVPGRAAVRRHLAGGAELRRRGLRRLRAWATWAR